MKKEKVHYEQGIIQYKNDLKNLQTDKNNLEKYAREQYLMKKDNEDVFLIVDGENVKLVNLNLIKNLFFFFFYILYN